MTLEKLVPHNMSIRKVLLGLAALGIVAMLFAFLAITIQRTRQTAMRISRVSQLKQISLSIHNFRQAYKRFPPSVFRDKLGRPLGSWRFHILPFLDALMIDVAWEQPWDSPDHRWLSSNRCWPFCLDFDNTTDQCLQTNVLAVVGPGTAFDDGRTVSPETIPDSLILLVEVAHTGIHWMEPGDLSVDNVPPSITTGLDGKGFLVLFANGEIWYLRSDIPLDVLKSFFTIDSARQQDRDRLLSPHGYLVR